MTAVDLPSVQLSPKNRTLCAAQQLGNRIVNPFSDILKTAGACSLFYTVAVYRLSERSSLHPPSNRATEELPNKPLNHMNIDDTRKDLLTESREVGANIEPSMDAGC